MAEQRGQMTDADIDRLASAAFECDRRAGHHKGGPWTWHMLSEEGRENYRALIRAVLVEQEAILAAR